MVIQPSGSGWKLRKPTVSARFPIALKVGVADRAKSNWPFLTKHTSDQILDFYHAAEYLTTVADAQFQSDPRVRKQGLDDACTPLKHAPAGPQVLIEQMQGFLAAQKQREPGDKITAALTYFHAPAAQEIC